MNGELLYLTKASAQSGQEESLMPLTDLAGIKAPEPLLDIAEEVDASAELSPYQRWQLDPSKANLFAVTKSLKPTIDSVVASLGGTGSPDLQARARVVAAKAIQSYNPEYGATLPTWVSQQLRQLTRDIRKSNNVVAIPEGIQLDAYSLYKAESEFEEEHGREPTVLELADATGLSVKRIADVRNKMRPVAMESAYTQEGNNGIQAGTVDYSQDAQDYVYNDSDLIDRKVMEHSVGYGGAQVLDNAAIMKKLKLTAVQLSRRKKRLAQRMLDTMQSLESL